MGGSSRTLTIDGTDNLEIDSAATISLQPPHLKRCKLMLRCTLGIACEVLPDSAEEEDDSNSDCPPDEAILVTIILRKVVWTNQGRKPNVEAHRLGTPASHTHRIRL